VFNNSDHLVYRIGPPPPSLFSVSVLVECLPVSVSLLYTGGTPLFSLGLLGEIFFFSGSFFVFRSVGTVVRFPGFAPAEISPPSLFPTISLEFSLFPPSVVVLFPLFFLVGALCPPLHRPPQVFRTGPPRFPNSTHHPWTQFFPHRPHFLKPGRDLPFSIVQTYPPVLPDYPSPQFCNTKGVPRFSFTSYPFCLFFMTISPPFFAKFSSARPEVDLSFFSSFHYARRVEFRRPMGTSVPPPPQIWNPAFCFAAFYSWPNPPPCCNVGLFDPLPDMEFSLTQELFPFFLRTGSF